MFVKGRIHKVGFLRNGIHNTVWNVHNEDIPANALRPAPNAISSDFSEAHNSPQGFCVFFAGDVNFERQEAKVYSYSSPDHVSGSADTSAPLRSSPAAPDVRLPVHRRHPRSGQRILEHALRSAVEVVQSNPTRYNPSNQTATNIDRVWVSHPPWVCPLMQWTLSATDPYEFFFQRLSDHGPLIFSVVNRPVKLKENRKKSG